jgi:antitoxin component of RelBE/YafQ-DinJ toxin-antitoxin module
MEKQTTKQYTIQVEDTVFRCGQVTVSASSAAEAVMMARRMAYERAVPMELQAPDQDPWVHSIKEMGSRKGFHLSSVSNHCLTDDLEEIARADGLDSTAVEELLDEYENDIPEFF